MQQAREYIKERELPNKGRKKKKTLRRKIRRTLRERNGIVYHFV